MLDLTRIDLATEEDRSYHIDHWASLFRSATWDEIKTLTEKDAALAEMNAQIAALMAEMEHLQKG